MFFWIARMIMISKYLTGKAPFKMVYFHGAITDKHGAKMSKSKGNAIDPLPVIEKLGADTFRFWSASEINHGYDFRCNEQKIESTKKFLSKLWNVSRFLSSFPVIDSGIPNASDKWILSELDKLVQDSNMKLNPNTPPEIARKIVSNAISAGFVSSP